MFGPRPLIRIVSSARGASALAVAKQASTATTAAVTVYPFGESLGR